MSLEFVRRKIEKIPPYRRNLPLIVYEGKAYSPNFVLNEVMRGTELGEKLQRAWETASFNSTATLKELAKARLKWIVENLPPDVGLATFSGKAYSKEDLLRLIEKESEDIKPLLDVQLEEIREDLYG